MNETPLLSITIIYDFLPLNHFRSIRTCIVLLLKKIVQLKHPSVLENF
jgi:hypothetical protein